MGTMSEGGIVIAQKDSYLSRTFGEGTGMMIAEDVDGIIKIITEIMCDDSKFRELAFKSKSSIFHKVNESVKARTGVD